MEERFQGNTIVIACGDPGNPMAGILTHRYQARMWHVAAITARPALLEAASNPDTALIILDLSFPADGAAMISELRLRHAGSLAVPIVRTMTAESASREQQSFRIIADGEVVEPCEMSDLFAQVDRLLEEGRERIQREQSVMHFRFPGESRFVDDASELAARMLSSTELGDHEQVSACTAFRESVSGTIRHGRNAAGVLPVITGRCMASPGEVVFRISAPVGSGPWFDGSLDHRAHARADSLGLIRRCAADVRISADGDTIEVHCRRRA